MTLYQNVLTAMSPRFDTSALRRTCVCCHTQDDIVICRCKSVVCCASEECGAKVASNHSLDRCNTIKDLSTDIRGMAKKFRREPSNVVFLPYTIILPTFPIVNKLYCIKYDNHLHLSLDIARLPSSIVVRSSTINFTNISMSADCASTP